MMADVSALEREGLLAGVVSAGERAARVELLSQLQASGVSLAQLRRAVEQDRLALVPVEMVFAGDAQYTMAQAAEQAGLDEDFLIKDRLALGLSRPAADELVIGAEEMEALRGVRALLDAGLPAERVLELARVVGEASRRVAETALQIFAEQFLRAGDAEDDLGLRFAALAGGLKPMMGPLLETPVRLHMAEVVRGEVVGKAERTAGRLPGSRDVAICFADLVGFTHFGETRSAEDVGDLASHLERLAAQVATPPVRLVKMIGDAAMLVSQEAGPLVDAAVELAAACGAHAELPALRAGVAYGPALPRQGDWYGSSVNLASRITAAAPPAGVLVTDEVRSRTTTRRWRAVGARHFKGIAAEIPLFQVAD
jgi:adenylate cyclase